MFVARVFKHQICNVIYKICSSAVHNLHFKLYKTVGEIFTYCEQEQKQYYDYLGRLPMIDLSSFSSKICIDIKYSR